MGDLQEGSEVVDDAIDHITHRRERLKNWLTLDNLRFAERYGEGERDLIFRFSVEGLGMDYVARFQTALVGGRALVDVGDCQTVAAGRVIG